MGSETIILECPFCIYWWIRQFPPLRISSQLVGMFLAKIWIESDPKYKNHIASGIIGDIGFILTLICTMFIPENTTGGTRGSYIGLLDTILTPFQCMTMWSLACRKGGLSYLMNLSFFMVFGHISSLDFIYSLILVGMLIGGYH